MGGPKKEGVFDPDPELEEPAAAALLAEISADPDVASEEEPAPAAFLPARRAPAIAPANPDQWQTIVPLQRPLKVDGAVLASITVRCLSGDEFVNLAMSYGVREDNILAEVRAAMCDLHPAVISALAADDQAKVVAACRPFLPRPLLEDPDDVGLVAGALAAAADLPA